MSYTGDLHSALKTEEISSAEGGGVQFKLIKLQHSKEEIAYSLHANPKSFSLSGIQTVGLLSHLGFRSGTCLFFPEGKCLVSSVNSDFPLKEYVEAFSTAYSRLLATEKQLGNCGYILTHPEKYSSEDGHIAPQSKEMKQSEDEQFVYKMSWIEGGNDKGWTYHYYPKHPPISEEVSTVFDFLKISEFKECPYFDFKPCFYRFIIFEKREESFFGSNAEYVHRCFDNHATSFSAGIEGLLEVEKLLRPFDFNFLPRSKHATTKIIDTPVKSKFKNESIYEFDVAVSFAGTERTLAEQLSTSVKEAGYRVFYDSFYPEQLWGKDLIVFFDEIYRKRSKYCVIFVSQEYIDRIWTNHERKSAQARAIEERGNEYILPIKVEDVELPGFQPTIGYLNLADYGIAKIAEILIEKLSSC